jgi:myosin heavy subunit
VSDQDFHNAIYQTNAASATASNASVGGPNGMVITPNRVRRSHNSSNLSVGPNGMLIQPHSVMMDTIDTGRTSRRTADSTTLHVSIQQQKFLLRMVKTLSRKLQKADDKIKGLKQKQHEYQDLTVQLTKAEEHLEYSSEENTEYLTRIRALEQALLMQETELDQAVATIRQFDEERRKRDLLEQEQATNPFAADDSAERLKTEEELACCKQELEQLNLERDTAVNKATQLSIALAEIRAEADEFRDQLSECRTVIAHLRERQDKSSPNGGKRGGFFWAKTPPSGTEKAVNANDGVDKSNEVDIEPTEDNTSVSSGDWQHSVTSLDAGAGGGGFNPFDQEKEACVDLTL